MIFASALKGDFGGVSSFLDFIEFDLLPLLQILKDALSDPAFITAVQDMIDQFTDFIETASDSGALSSMLEGVTTALEVLTDLLSDPKTGPAIKNLIAWSLAFKGFNIVMLGLPGAALRGVGRFFGRTIQGLFTKRQAKTVAERFGQNIRSAFRKIQWRRIFSGIGAAFAGLGRFIGRQLGRIRWPNVLRTIWTSIRAWFTGIPGRLAGLLRGLTWTRVATALVSALRVLLVTIGKHPIIAAIILALLGILLAALNWDKIKEWLGNVWDNIVSWFRGVWNGLKSWFSGLSDRISEWVNIGALARKFTDWVKRAGRDLRQRLRDRGTDIGNWFKDLPFKIGYWAGRLATKFVEWVKKAGPKLKTYLQDRWEEIKDWFASLPGRFSAWATRTWNSFIDWISPGMKKTGLWGALQARWREISDWFEELPGRFAIWATATWNAFTKWLDQDIGVPLGEVWDDIYAWIVALPGQIIATIDELWDEFFAAGRHMVEGILEGVGSFDPIGWGRDIVQGFLAGVEDESDAQSPAKAFIPAGRNIALGIGVGLTEGMDEERKRLKGTVAGLGRAVNAGIGGIQMSMGEFGPLGLTNAINANLGEQQVNLVVTIGERDITDIVDARVSRSSLNMARAIHAGGRR